MKNNSGAIIFDVDGVLLDMWTAMKDMYEKHYGMKLVGDSWIDIVKDYERNPFKYMEFGKIFELSDVFENLKPLPGSRLVVNKLKRDFDLHILTAASDSVRDKRIKNIEQVFGKNIFSDINCVGGSCKSTLLKQYSEHYEYTAFVDDHPKNIIASTGVVTQPIWFENNVYLHAGDKMDYKHVKPAKNILDIIKIVKETQRRQI